MSPFPPVKLQIYIYTTYTYIMNSLKRYTLVMLLSLAAMMGWAQNTLTIPDLQGAGGKVAMLPIYMTNGQEVAAVQFNLHLPFAVADDQDAAISEARSGAGHTIGLRHLGGNVYTVVIAGLNNKPLPGNAGVLAEIPMRVANSAQPGDTFPVSISDMVLADRSGRNICSTTEPCQATFSINREPTPDILCSGITATEGNIRPGEALTVNWTVENVGDATTGGGWTENVYLVNSATGRTLYLGKFYQTQALEAGAKRQRTETISLPQALHMDGEAQIRVSLTPNSDTPEYLADRSNNTAVSAQAYGLTKALFMTTPVSNMQEGGANVRVTLTRSGDDRMEEVVSLSSLPAGVLTVPAEVTFAEGQSNASFLLSCPDNNEVNTYEEATFSTVAANGYAAISLTMGIEDNDMLPLTIKTDKTEYNEGETIHATVSVPKRIGQDDLTVYFTIEQGKRFRLPASVTFAQGATEASIDIPVLDDNLPANTISIELTATADRHEKASTLFILNDDDVPAINMSLTPTTVSEGDGPQAIQAVISRSDVTNSIITINLSDDGDGSLYYQKTITLAEGQTTATLPIAVIDNSLADGKREVNLTAEVYISSCSCNVVGTKQTSVTQTITILDNDGKALALNADKGTILEGDADGVVITLSRNDNPTADLTANIKVNAAGLTVPATVTIPAGERTASFSLVAPSNDTQEGNRVVTIMAEAEGFNSGTSWVMVTDQTLPDIELTSLDLSVESLEAGTGYEMKATLTNVGAATVPAGAAVTFSGAGSKLTLTTTEEIAVGGQAVLKTTFTAPEVPGDYTLAAEANASGAITELQTRNNLKTATLQVTTPYTYTLKTDKKIYLPGETIAISGKVTSGSRSVAAVEVEPYIIYYGVRIPLTVITSEDGSFSTTYKLTESMSGDFKAGVCLPKEGLTEAMCEVSVYGMARTSNDYIKNQLYIDEPYVQKVGIKNLSSLPLHNLKVQLKEGLDGYIIEAKGIDVLEANGTAEMEIAFLGQKQSADSWDVATLVVTSDEGAKLDIVTYNYTSNRHASLTLSTKSINTTVTKGTTRTYPIILTNTGLGETGKIKVDVPTTGNFVSLATPAELPSMATGDSVTIMLKFNPGDLDVNIIQKGSLSINCENADGQLVYFNVKVVSNAKGNLVVRVQDENTIYGNAAGEHPYVKGAEVTVKDYNTGAVLYSGTTGAEGTIGFDDVDEGYYTVYVTAPKHDSYIQNVLVSPGETTEHLATISYQPISIRWDVQETTVEDKYEIVSEIVYETHVPVPVVRVTQPDNLDLNQVSEGGNILFNIVVRNDGLITAKNVNVKLPSADGFDFTPLAQYSGFELAPEQSRIIPVYVSLASDTAAEVKKHLSALKASGRSVTYHCSDETYLDWEWVCGPDSKYAWLRKPIKWLLRTCTPEGTPDSHPSTGTGPGGGGGGGGWGPDYGPVHWTPSRPVSQIDLYSAYQWASKISCAMVCLARDPIGDRIGKFQKLTLCSFDPWEWKFKAPNLDCFKPEEPTWRCILNAVTKDYAKKKVDAKSMSLRERYVEKMELWNGQKEYTLKYLQDMVNAPELVADDETFSTLLPFLTDVNWKLDQWHTEGTLYDKEFSEIFDHALGMIPQGMANTHDFSLKSYLERQINTYRKQDGLLVASENLMSSDLMKEIEQASDEYKQKLAEWKCVSQEDFLMSIHYDAEAINNGSGSTCATVKLSITQELVLTRQAFRGTMTIENSSDTDLTDISALITATDENGTVATSHEMQINVESVTGMGGSEGKWSLKAGETGTITYLFIPTKYAAPTFDVRYSFGGTLYFNDGEDLQVRSLLPVTLTVRPTPELDLTYFVQRDIYGDNPLTPGVTEPVIPAEFSVLINNKGYGEATDVRMITHQPEIIENEKGLLVDFAIVSSSLNGAPATMALEDDIATNFGNIPAGTSAYATWGLTSSLLGHFKEYDVRYTHLSSYGNPDLSLLDKVTIHELIHSVNTTIGGKPYRAWVTNDDPDLTNAPDQIYLSNGTHEDLSTLTDVTDIEALGASRYRVTTTTPTRGWFYTNVHNPAGRRAKVLSIKNEDTGEIMDSDNFWTTDYTMRTGNDPLEEYRLHIVDLADGPETRHYIVEYEPMPEVELTVVSIETVPTDEDIAEATIEELTVTFSKDIKPETFTREDIVVRREGATLDTELPISKVDDHTFTLNTSALSQNGYYMLQVNTSTITDHEGFVGTDGRMVRWMLYKDGLVHYNVNIFPSDQYGTLEGAKSQALKYGSQVEVKAVPFPGTSFRYWGISGGAVVTTAKSPKKAPGKIDERDISVFSYDSIISLDMVRDYNLYAVFEPKPFTVTVNCDAAAGSVNLPTGIYNYGDTLSLKALANEGYSVDGFMVNDLLVSAEDEAEVVVKGNTVIDVVFTDHAPKSIILTESEDYTPIAIDNASVVLLRTFYKGVWNTVCLPCDVTDIEAAFGKGTQVAQLSSLENGVVNFTMVDEMKANVPYIIMVGMLENSSYAEIGDARTTTYLIGNTALCKPGVNGTQDSVEGLTFVGTYDNAQIDKAVGNYYLSNNKFYYVDADANVHSERFRGYFHADDNNVKNLEFWTEITGVKDVLVLPDNTDVYTLDGLKIQNPGHIRRGVHITGGRKVLVK